MALSFEQLLDVNVDKVYGASRFEQKVTDAPASVSLITREEITRQGHRTLADVLRGVNGLFVSDDRNYSYLGIRGFNRPGDYNSRVLVLVDGHRVNDNVFEQAFYGNEAVVDADVIERVEVIRGPSSSIYGDNAFFGVVNVITRTGRSLNGLEASVEGGGFESYRARASYGRQFTNGMELFLSGSWYDSQGDRSLFFPEFFSPTNHNGVARNADEERGYHFNGSLKWNDFTLSGAWTQREKNVPTASFFTTFNDGGEITTDERAYVDLKYEHEVVTGLQVVGRVAYDASYYRGHYPYGIGSGRVLNVDEADGDWLSTDWQFNWQVFEHHRLVAGVDYRENLRVHQENYDASPAASYLGDTHNNRNFGAYAQAESQLLTNLLLNAGVRFDNYSTFGSTLNPRTGLIYSPWQQTSFKALYGEAFRAPNAYELYYSYPGQAKPNPSLEPEKMRTYELVFEQSLPANLRFTAAGYYYRIENLAEQTIDPMDGLLVYRNTREVEARGVELELEGRYARGLTARMSYALQKAEDRTSGTELSNSPRHNAKASLIVPIIADKLYSGLELQYVGRVRTVNGNWTRGTFLVNATLFSQRLARGLELSASIYNLLDDRHGYSASTEHFPLVTIPQPARSFRVKLTYHF